MKSLRYKKIGEHLIFEKFDKLPIDPEMTRIVNQETMNQSPEQQTIDQKLAKKMALQKRRIDILKKIRFSEYLIKNSETAIKETTDKIDAQTFKILVANAPRIAQNERKKLKEQDRLLEICDIELTDLHMDYVAKRRKIISQNPIFSHPRRNEIALSDTEYDQVKAIVQSLQNESLSFELMIEEKIIISETDQTSIKAPFFKIKSYHKIPNFIGAQYFWHNKEKWIEGPSISEVGKSPADFIPPEYLEHAIEKNDLSPAQLEEIRLQNLSAQEKDGEKKRRLALLLREAALKKSELEILGNSEALTESQAYYEEQATIIEEKYK